MKKLFTTLLIISFASGMFASGHVATANGTNPTCFGFCNGSAVAAVSGGVGPYGYSWTGPSGYTGTGTNISALCAGTYVVTVVDSSDMSSATYTLNLTQPSAVYTVLSGGGTICQGNAMSLFANSTGGTPGYTFSWSPSAGLSSTTVHNPLAAPATTTTYTITVTDANGCTATSNTTITVNPAPVITVNSPTICAGQSAVLTATGASTYAWTPGGMTGSTVTVFPTVTTTYTVTGTSAGCSATAISTVTVSPSGNASFSYSSSTYCVSGANPVPAISGTSGGSFSVSPAGLIFVSTSTGEIDLASSTLGTYTITYTIGGPCPASSTATITLTNTPSANFSYAGPYCQSGIAIPSFPPGSSAGTFSSSGLVFMSPNGDVNLAASAAGTYTVMNTIPASGGCAAVSFSNTITINPSPVVTVSPTHTTCGACNGSITTSAPGGTTFSWTGPAGFTSNTQNPTGLCSGTYTLTATGTTGCSTTITATVNGSPLIYTMVSSNTPSNCGACDGSATVYATGGFFPYTYLWSPTGNTTATGTNLCAGTYTVIVTDNNGCSATQSVVINSTSSMTGTVTSTATSCGACNGSANVTVSGGSGPFTYDWTPGIPAGDGTASITGLCVGNYTVLVTDNSGCTYTGSTTISSTTPVYVTANSTPSTCGTCNGTVTVMQSGGTGPYLYDLSNGSPQQTNGNFSGVCAGMYVATVTDANGCSGIYTVSVSTSNSTNIVVNGIVQNETGFGLGNGSINLVVSGAAPPFTFLWSNGAITEDIYSLGAGSYSVTVTDNNGECATYTYTVSTAPAYGYVTGYTYMDNNMNCLYDGGDNPLSGYYVSVTNGTSTYWGYTNTMGYYSIWVPTGGYTVNAGTTTNLEAGCTNIYSVTVTGGSTIPNNNFAYFIPPVYDVCVTTYSTGIVPGFNGYYYTNVHNYGNMPATGVVYIVLPGIVNYVSSTPAASSVSGDTVFWNYTNIPAYNSQYFYVTFYTPPTAVLGTPVVAYVNATVTNGTDVNPACNYYVYTRIITGSFDPNDKTVSPSGTGATGDIALTEDEFSYLIRFQNTGSGPAVNINVTDTLSSLLDRMSFQMMDASHNYVVEMLPGNVIRWKFTNIMLPDSTTDEAGSHGHVQFKINKLNTPVAGQVIENRAYIYFDFNEAVITNTAINTYVTATSIKDETTENGSVKVFPNPFSESTTFVIQSNQSNEIYSFEMTDVLGKTVKSVNNITDKQFSVSRDGLENGIYFYKIYTTQSLTGVGKVIIK